MAIEAQRTSNPWLWARVVSFLLGVWLIISAFAWPHSRAQRLDTWIVGVWIAAFALMAMMQPSARWLNTLAAIWLFFSTLAIAHAQSATVWNNVIVAILVFALSLVGVTGERRVAARRPLGA